jgi:hypothetical protein
MPSQAAAAGTIDSGGVRESLQSIDIGIGDAPTGIAFA